MIPVMQQALGVFIGMGVFFTLLTILVAAKEIIFPDKDEEPEDQEIPTPQIKKVRK